jgi:hypothetical protein
VAVSSQANQADVPTVMGPVSVDRHFIVEA